MNPSPVVHVVDDDASFRDAISALLRSGRQEEVRSYATAREFLQEARDDTPGCVLLDMQMPGGDGLELQAALGSRGIRLPVIFLTGHGDVPSSVAAMKAGAVDFLTKPVTSDVLFGAVDAALEADRRERATREHDAQLRARYESLTQREREVYTRIAAGLLNKQVAAELQMGERTVKAHRAQIMTKMAAHSFAELVSMAREIEAQHA